MVNQITSFMMVLSVLLGTSLAAIYIGDNQNINGDITVGPYDDVVIGGRPSYAPQPNYNRYRTSDRPSGGNGIYVGNGNTIRGTVRSDFQGTNLNLGSLPSSYNYRARPSSNYYNSYPSQGRAPGIVIGNGNRIHGGALVPYYNAK